MKPPLFGGIRLWLVVLSVLVWAELTGCDYFTGLHHDSEFQRRGTLGEIYNLVLTIEKAMIDTGHFSPGDGAALASWLLAASPEKAQGDFVRYDVKQGQFVDPWGRPLVLVVESGILTALGSCGPNGIWEGGSGDDILVKLADCQVPSGPVGAPIPK